jgi:tetratricopeptide (TPR) repeat protein
MGDAKIEDLLARVPDHRFLNVMLGFEAMFQRDDHAAAARHIEAALEAEPRAYAALLAAAVLADSLGKLDLAIRIGEYMTARDPMGFWGHLNLGSAYLARGDTEQAISAMRTAENINPAAGAVQWKLGFALLVNGDIDAALEHFEQEEHLPYRLHGLATALHDSGDAEGSASALEELREHLESSEGEWDGWSWGLARAYAWLGDADSAFHYLELAREAGNHMFGLPNNPYFARIKDDPRWQLMTESVERKAAEVRFDPKLPPEILAIQ